MSVSVTTWSLEQTSAGDLRPAGEPPAGVRVVRAEVPSPEFSRYLYAAVGGDLRWTDRLALGRSAWREIVERPGTETWVAYEHGTPAGYLELAGGDDGVVEIVYFGLLPQFRGRRIGGCLLAYGTARAWDLATRWPGRKPTERVWLHTCSLDGEYAMANYERRGFRLFDTRVEEEPDRPAPALWPAP
ncbi:GNAT family N-acetyltransferase [Streptomyces sp. ODS05-4]|uniref:GNAT family N-acetyltransferase n=1 Tax=Streptomyces sp. ODS05-4 TaxID=2944939 RepID=UPI002108DD3E|nr:GNAT family N-acetyltransferase [Streptomyces sp. ODS05-4]